MSQNLYRTLYCSRNWIAGDPPQQEAEIQSILAVARSKNSQQHVTGALLFNSGYFAQVLEGPRSAIETIFETIQRDERHGDIVILESGYADQRDFSDWSMAYVQPPSEQQSKDLAITLDQAFTDPTMSANAVLSLLRNLVIQED